MSNTATRIDTFHKELSGKPIVLYVSDCADCGVVFGMTVELEKRRRDDKRAFYCPNGHTMIFKTSTADELRAELDRERAALDQERDAVARTRADLAHERTQHAATKGKLTKTIKRAAAGVCPFCTRTFQNMQRHIDRKHPDGSAHAIVHGSTVCTFSGKRADGPAH